MAKIDTRRRVKATAHYLGGSSIRYTCVAGHTWTEDMGRKSLPVTKRLSASAVQLLVRHWEPPNAVTIVCPRCANPWTFNRNSEGDIEAHDGERVRAVIVRHPKAARSWAVHRIRHLLDGTYELQGSEAFRTVDDAKDFCCNRPGIWGR